MKITCLIPTYNEAPRIKSVLSIVASHPLVDEVLVIDDGSRDETQNIVREMSAMSPKIRLIVHSINQGKTMAICTGIKEAQGEYLMLIDADLLGITHENLTHLIEPVTTGVADVTISLRGNTPGLWKKIGLDYISGERVLPRSFFLAHVEALPKLPRFGLESYMNRYIIQSNYRIKIVAWQNVASPFKYKKQGLIKGAWGEVKMILDIFRTITPVGPVYQIIRMKRLEVK